MADHPHHHCNHGHSCESEHVTVEELQAREQFSLFQYVDHSRAFSLNEEGEGNLRKVFKPYDRRLDKIEVLRSDCDEQLIIYIQFTCDVKLTSFCISGVGQESSPKTIKAWKNRSDINFDNADIIKPLQEWSLQPDLKAEIDYPVAISQWHGVSSLLFFIPNNFGAEQTVIAYIGLKGSYQQNKQEPVIAVYEAKPQAKDHKNADENMFSRGIF